MPAQRVVELLVHGVGGSSPTEQLDDPRPELVAGDKVVGFYRHRMTACPPTPAGVPAAGAAEVPPTPGGGHRRAGGVLLG